MEKAFKLFTIVFLLSGILVKSISHGQVVLQRCDVKNLWQGSNTLIVDTANKKEGIASIGFSGSGTNWFSKRFSQTNTGIDENGWFNLWLYISDVSMMTGDGQIELSSSGNPDTNEYSWELNSLGLIDGWNHIHLEISSSNKSGYPDLKSINFFRIYGALSGSITARLDDLRFTNSKVQFEQNDPLYIKKLDYSTLDGKVMFGYQGWFAHPDDGSAWGRWRHWGSMQDAETIQVDMFPDMRELEPDEKYSTNLTFIDGRPVKVYSAYNRKTVMRHMKWLRDYDLDGVFLQRFYPNIVEPDLLTLRDTVTKNVMYGCEKYDRAFVNMYDLTWRDHIIDMDLLIEDWKHLVDDLKITESPNYLWHRGKPLVSLWGFTNRDNLSVSQLEKLIDFFENCPDEKYRASIMLGTNQDFHEKASWEAALSKVDVISPWTVGRFQDANSHQDFIEEHILPGQDWCDQRNVDFLPVLWPGFSWYNTKRAGEYQKNQRPRDGGNFYWAQSTRTVSSNAKMVYIAMFDEVDEGTAMYKLAETHEDSPAQGFWVSLDQDGYDLPSDWYLRCAKLTTQVVRGVEENRINLDNPPDGIDQYQVEVQSSKCGINPGKLTFHYPRVSENSILQFSIDGGKSYSYTTNANSTYLETGDLNSGVFDVWMRRLDGNMETDLGPYTILDAYPDIILKTKKTNCGLSDGEIIAVVGDNPYLGPVQISIDGGNNYNLTTADGKWEYSFPNLGWGEYNVWARFADGSCGTEIGTVRIDVEPIPVTLYYSIDGAEMLPADGEVIYGCPGKSLDIMAEPGEDSWDWSWFGHFNFQASGKTIRFADTLDPLMFNMYAKYYVAYSDDISGCELKYQEFVVRESPSCILSIDDLLRSTKQIHIYPNPVNDFLYINPGELEIDLIEISDISGRKVFSLSPYYPLDKVQIDTSSYKEGIYIYRDPAIQKRFPLWTICGK